jgi:hypothetical protein
MAILNASKTYLAETYLRQWVKTVGDHFSVEFAEGTEFDPFRRMRLTCNKCSQTLTCDLKPEMDTKIDWALQKFVNLLHRHDSKVELVKMPETPSSPMTVDFKLIKSKTLKHKEGRKFRETN